MLANCSSTAVEHSNTDPEIKGSNPAATEQQNQSIIGAGASLWR
jgi:hypothetical protein